MGKDFKNGCCDVWGFGGEPPLSFGHFPLDFVRIGRGKPCRPSVPGIPLRSLRLRVPLRFSKGEFGFIVALGMTWGAGNDDGWSG